MKRLIAAVMLLTLSMSIASAAKVNIKEVIYDSSTQSFTFITEVENMCNGEIQYRIRGCTDLVVPFTCVVDLRADGGENCGRNSITKGYAYLDEMGLYVKQMSGGTVIFQNEDGKTRRSVKLSILK